MTDQSLDSLLDVSGVGNSTLKVIREAGYQSLSDLAGADRNELKDISGVGSSTADNIIRFLDQEGLREQDPVTENQRKLQQLLRELFQFDVSDLDFGIYRIMNQKRDVIDEFIDQDLIQAVHTELAQYEEAERDELEQEVEAAKQDVIENLPDDALDEQDRLNDEYRDFPVGERYTEAVEQLEAHRVSEETEAQIFNDLYKFLSRYYENGDFIPKRRYSTENKYAVPYNGEETHFYWANQNQYFIKTSEHFTNYQFQSSGLTVSFELRNANIETDNNKNDDRYFLLYRNNPIRYDPEDSELTILFEYRPLTDEDYDAYDTSSRAQNKQRDIREHIEERVLADVPDSVENTLTQFAHNSSKRILERHLHKYTTKNTSDYFVHKDLDGFLERELEFYIKNEVLDLTGLTGSTDQVEHELNRAQVVAELGQRIIDFLAQIEDFQRTLWEKKKFVTKTEYCITLNKIPEVLYSTIAANEDQLAEWRDLYGFEERDEQGLGRFMDETEIDEEFLRSHPYIMVDTKFFGEEFKQELVSTFTNLNDEVDGVLIKGENFQALNLLLEKYRNQIRCIYIDPPYNTGSDDFQYKDNYRHASWLSLMSDRINIARELMSDDASIFISIDDKEEARLQLLLNSVFGESNHLANIHWRRKKETSNDGKGFANKSEYVISYRTGEFMPNREPLDEDYVSSAYRYTDENGRWRPVPITVDAGHQGGGYNYRIETPSGRTIDRTWRMPKETYEEYLQNDSIYFGKDGDSIPQRKRYLSESDGVVPDNIWYDTATNKQGKKEILRMFGSEVYDTPKPSNLIERILTIGTNKEDTDYVLDFFAGSGTTGQAVIDINQEDDGNRKYILVEMSGYFDTVLKPRIQKRVYTSDWDDAVPENQSGTSHIFKYHYIESYEDSLDNISFSGERQTALDAFDDYLLNYMLDFETQKSDTRLNVDQLSHPFEYQLRLRRDSGTETKQVDLVETFNYLLGLAVETIESHTHQEREYRVVRGSLDEDEVTVIWRNSDELDLEEEQEFVEEEVLSGGEDIVYVNGDSIIPGARSLESVFKNRMERNT